MKISNKLSTKDFRELQKVLLEGEEGNPFLMFFLRWIMNFLRAFAAALAIYILMLKVFSKDDLIIPVSAGILVFILLVLRFPFSYRKKMHKIINRAYGLENLDIVRDTIIDDAGISYIDRGNDKSYSWNDLVFFTENEKRLYFVMSKSQGTVINMENLSPEERNEIRSFIPREKEKTDIL